MGPLLALPREPGHSARAERISLPPPFGTRKQTAARALVVVAAALLCSIGPAGGCAPEDPLETIRAQHAEERFRPTVERLRQLVDENPGDSQANLLLGVALLRTGESGSAIWPLRAAASDPSLSVEAGLLLTEAALESRFKDEAIAAASAVLALEPDNIAALEMRIEAYQDAGRNDEVLDEVTRVLELDPENKNILVPRIVAYLAKEDEESAAEALLFAQKALEEDPDENEVDPGVEASRARLCVVTGMFSLERGDPEAADAQYERCLEAYPLNHLVVQEAVAYYDGTSRSNRATEILETALAQEPTSRFRVLLAQRMKNLGKLEKAEQLFREEAEENPSPNAWFVLGDHYVRRDMLSEAVDAFEQAVNAAADPPAMISFAYADTLIQAGQLDDARKAAEELQGTPMGDLIQGRVFAAEENWDEALATLEKGIQLWPNNPGARLLAGEAAEKLGRFDDAISHYRESIRADKTQSEAALRLALLQEAQGQDMHALERIGLYVRARANDPEGYAISIRLAHRVGQWEIVRQGLSRLSRLQGQRGVALAISARLAGQQRGAKESVKLIKESPLDLTEPMNADALEVLVFGLLRTGDAEAAQRVLILALDAHPDCADFHALLGQVVQHRGAATDAGASHYRRATELDPDHVAALTALGDLQAKGGRIDSALELYERASLADPRKPAAAVAALQLLADHVTLEERKARAEEWLLRHLHSARIASELALIEAEQGQDLDRALALARRASRFDRGRRTASIAAFQAVADSGTEPQAGLARSALEVLVPEPANPKEVVAQPASREPAEKASP